MDSFTEVARSFMILDVEEDQHMTIVAYKLKGGATTWWQSQVNECYHRRPTTIRYWTMMKQMIEQFILPNDHAEIMYNRYHDCIYGNNTMN